MIGTPVEIAGTPNLTAKVPGGFPGDLATPAMLVNAIPRVLATPAGLTSVEALPLLSVFPEKQVEHTLLDR